MLKKILVILLVLVAMLACGKKSDKQNEPLIVTDSRFFPVPEFSVLFETLDHLQRADFDNALSNTYYDNITDVYVASFYLGNLTADAIIATKARNKAKLFTIAQAMIEYSKMIGINEEVLKLSDELMSLIQEDKWEDLQNILEEYKVLIELSLYETNQLDLMTLVQCGGWTQGIRIMTGLLQQGYKRETTTILNQKGIIDNIVNNLAQMENRDLYDVKWMNVLQESYDEIFSIIHVQGKETFTLDEVKALNLITANIIKEMSLN